MRRWVFPIEVIDTVADHLSRSDRPACHRAQGCHGDAEALEVELGRIERVYENLVIEVAELWELWDFSWLTETDPVDGTTAGWRDEGQEYEEGSPGWMVAVRSSTTYGAPRS